MEFYKTTLQFSYKYFLFILIKLKSHLPTFQFQAVSLYWSNSCTEASPTSHSLSPKARRTLHGPFERLAEGQARLCTTLFTLTQMTGGGGGRQECLGSWNRFGTIPISWGIWGQATWFSHIMVSGFCYVNYE